MGSQHNRRPPQSAPRKEHELRFPVEGDILRMAHLAAAVTGESVASLARRAVRRESDRVLFRRPGALLWLRPGTRVYEVVGEPGPDGVAVVSMLAEAAGGERVWPWSRLEELPPVMLPEGEIRGSGIVCDLTPEEGRNGLSVRRVVVAASDVMPRHPGRVGQAGRNPRMVRPAAGPGPICGVRVGEGPPKA